MPDNVQMQGIEFEIKGDAKEATASLKETTKEVEKTGRAVEATAKAVEKASKSKIGKIIDSSSISAQVRRIDRELERSKKAVEKYYSDIEKIHKGKEAAVGKGGGIDLGELDKQEIALRDRISDYERIQDRLNEQRQKVLESLGAETPSGKAPDEVEKTGEAAQEAAPKLKENAKAADEAANGHKRLASVLSSLRPKIDGVANVVGKLGKRLGSGVGKTLARPFIQMGNSVKNAVSKIGQLESSFKRILFYRAIRSIIKEIGQAFKEGTDNLYYYSQAVGTQFAQSMDQLATAFQYFKNSVGAAASPLINALAPAIDYVIDRAVALLNVLNQLFARLSGAAFWTRATKQAKQYGAAVGGAGGAAKEAMRYLAPFDELNVLPDNSSGGGGGGGGGGGYEDMFEEVAIDSALADFVDRIKAAINAGDWAGAGKILGDKINELIPSRAKFAEWGEKIGSGIQHGIDFINGAMREIKFENIGSGLSGMLIGLIDNIDPQELGALFAQKLSALTTLLWGFVTDFTENNGWANIGGWLAGVIEGWFSEIEWDKLGEAVSGGIAGLLASLNEFLSSEDTWREIGESISSFLENFDWGSIWEQLTKLPESLSKAWNAFLDGLGPKLKWIGDLAVGIGLAFAGWKIATGVFDGVTKIKDGLGSIKGLFGGGKAAGEAASAATEATNAAGDAAGQLGDAVGSGLTGKLKSLVKNLGLGLVAITEVIAAAALIVGGIALLGWELQLVAETWAPVIEQGELVTRAMLTGSLILGAVGLITYGLGTAGTALAKNLGIGILVLAEISVAADLFIAEIALMWLLLNMVGQTWQPVIANGDTIINAILIGSGILLAIGVVTFALGTLAVAGAGTVPLAIGIGTAMLAELSLATDLFLVEIVAIGLLLTEVGKAWQPVLDNGETIATGIALGTALLVGIGVVTAALGVASVASVGLLPLAIGLGTALLVELGAAFVAFSESLVGVAKELSDNLAPALEQLNDKLPKLSSDMKDFVGFMTEFAGHVVQYTEVSAISALAGTIDTIIGWFTEDPIKKLADDVKKTYDQTAELNTQLDLAVPELQKASQMLQSYQNFIDEIQELTAAHDNTALSGTMLTNMMEVGKNLVIGLASGMSSQASALSSAFDEMETAFQSFVDGMNRIWDAANKDTSTKWDAIKKTVSTKLLETGAEITKRLTTIKNDITKAWATINTLTSTAWGTTIKNTISSKWDQIIRVKAEKTNTFKNELSVAWDSMNTIAGQKWDGIKSTILDKFGSIQSGLQTAWNELYRWWSNLTLPAFNVRVPSFSMYGSFDPKTGQTPSINVRWNTYAQGGFPEDGLFFANHGELVGEFSNGKTAVANNEQIIEGIKAGVYEAVVDAFGRSDTRGGSDAPIIINLDGKQIAKTTTRVQHQMARANG